MRPIDGDKLYAVLENIAAHLLETKSEPQCGMARTIGYVMEIVKDQPDIVVPPPNDPLTLDELRGMDGEPVWVVPPKYKPRWALVKITWTITMLVFNDGKMEVAEVAMFENGYKIYRRKPEEAHK